MACRPGLGEFLVAWWELCLRNGYRPIRGDLLILILRLLRGCWWLVGILGAVE